ncbi:hypothetical protein BpJC7_19530 [Weizmannia acidilactici]|uniref:Uncharacterized protein n=1 Tax=Weizmannia acidilactici TaxID=2607726 RepID=A0A5J4JJC0_9BACI|nr:hypothetical protein [Weizmannia acidilactici]GER66650.1 hypothetical protein BpJC4_11210 [Weizmannia acidilactici]GER70650.1 hypothetical protein BpJC7_19530 [Weizmannia acidilactici]GER72810.1 hypothetical protein BpPP18_08770 [Weizmannia acidilactici]
MEAVLEIGGKTSEIGGEVQEISGNIGKIGGENVKISGSFQTDTKVVIQEGESTMNRTRILEKLT